MPVDDLWYLTKRGAAGERAKTKRHGRGKRWRVRYKDAHGESRERLFERKTDAEGWDVLARSGATPETKVDKSEQRITFREYGERWRQSREPGWAVETRKRVESNLRCHLYPEFGNRPVRAITLTSALEWLAKRIEVGTPKSSLRLYFELLSTVFAAAMNDRVITDNPCDGVKLSQILRGLSLAPKWIPTDDEVLNLFDAVPARYRAALWLGGGQGLRLGEALGMEDGPRCADADAHELHVVQQLRYSPKTYSGFYLTEPKAGSSGTIDLDATVAARLFEHIRSFPPVTVELIDITSGDPVPRSVPLLFTTTHGNPINDKTWSREWVGWRDAAGWPKDHGGFHALRHYFATTLITNHVAPQEVQRLLRHKTLRITLETYVGWWPKQARSQGIIGAALTAATRSRGHAEARQDPT